MAALELFLCLLIFSFEAALSEYCEASRRRNYEPYSRNIYCAFGCCGTLHEEYCCMGNAGVIVGLVFAGICALAFFSLLMCCCMKHSSHRGRLIHPSSSNRPCLQSNNTHANIFILPAAATTSTAYRAHQNNEHATSGYPDSNVYTFPDSSGLIQPPAYSQIGATLPPVYNQPGAPLYPVYNQPGPPVPPAYNQPGPPVPPAYNQPGQPVPPPFNQPGQSIPPPYNQSGGPPPTYTDPHK